MTCRAILVELSSKKYDEPLLQTILSKYQAYKNPINRTVDIISSNSAFISQLYTAIRFGLLEKPSEKDFNWFFVRLIEEELRR